MNVFEITRRKEADTARLFLGYLKEWNAALVTRNAPLTLQAIDRKISTILIAFQRTADPNRLDLPEMARDFAIHLFDYLDQRGRWADWLEIGKTGLDACTRQGDSYSLGDAYATILNSMGIARRMFGDYKGALFDYEKALLCARSNEILSDAQANHADLFRLIGKLDLAMEAGKLAVELGHQAQDSSRVAKGLEYLGLVHTANGSYALAIELYREALALRQSTGNVRRTALTFTFLAYALTLSGEDQDLDEALVCYENANAIDTQLENWQGIARYQGDIAVLYNKLGQYTRAIEYSQIALDRNDRLQFYRGVALNHARLLDSYLRLGDIDAVRRHAGALCEKHKHLSTFDIRVSKACDLLLEVSRHAELKDQELSSTCLLTVNELSKSISATRLFAEPAQKATG